VWVDRSALARDARGLEPADQDSKSAGDGSADSSSKPSSRRAGASGGARTGRPRQARIAEVVSGGWNAASDRSGPLLRGPTLTDGKEESGHFYFGEKRTSVLCADTWLDGGAPIGQRDGRIRRVEVFGEADAERAVAHFEELGADPSRR
jgi:hypothetical protein